ncbi:MAG: PTS sugar transporter subunit IIA [Treponema sp.]|nr:PTS sugar transporter subunit IIA [Treponema sp.]
MTHKDNWIDAVSMTVDLEDGDMEEIIGQLIELAKLNGKVSDADILEKDIMRRERMASTAIDDNIDVPHSLTAGVSDFCVSLGVVGHKKIFMLIAWNESNTKNLKQMAALLEAVKNAEEKILAATSGQEIFRVIEAALTELGVN